MIYIVLVTTSVLAGLLLAIIVAGIQAVRMALGGGKGGVQNGPWMTRLTYGSEEMSLHERAFLAIAGLWALQSSEVIYFTTFRDSDGRRLRFKHDYRIEGADLDTRWWSITVYRNFQFIPNQSNRYSFSKTSIQRQDDDAWSIRLSSKEESGNWLPLGDKRGVMAISLRLYNPHAQVYKNTRSIILPRIVRD